MNKSEITTDKIFLKSIFSNLWFRIPEYQRPYVWTSEEVTELLSDISFAMNEKADKEYFLGSFVFQTKKTKSVEFSHDENDLLDGQQRLTTLTLLFAVIRDIVSDDEAKKVCQNCIFQKGNQYMKIPERTRLEFAIREDVQDFINEYIKLNDGTSKIISNYDLLLKTTENESVKNMIKAVKVIHDFLISKKNEPAKLLTFMLNNVLMIFVSTEDLDDAFRLFTILNDRGIPLRNSDILKSINLGHLTTQGEKKKYAEIWEEAESNLGENFDRFLNHVRTLILKEKARSNLLQEYQEKIYHKKRLLEGKETFLLIEKYLNIHEKLLNGSNHHITNDFKFDNLIKVMNMGLPSNDWVPALLGYYDKFQYQEIYEFLVKLDIKFSADWIAQYSPTTRFENVCAILKEIDSANTPKELFASKYFDIDQASFKRNLEWNIYGRKYAKYILLKLDYYFQNHDQKMNAESISIEHILPQNPKVDSQWVTDFSFTERADLTDTLGNLVLITLSKNSSQSRLDYSDKKEKYFSKRIDVSSNSLRVLNKYNEWKVAQLQENHMFVLGKIYEGYEVK